MDDASEGSSGLTSGEIVAIAISVTGAVLIAGVGVFLFMVNLNKHQAQYQPVAPFYAPSYGAISDPITTE